MSDQSWRTDVDAGDYFLHQKKHAEIERRRPLIRNGSDLVGPGIGANAVRITDYNDLLATFNGYFSSKPGADSAPNTSEGFVGQVVSDSELGGTQKFTGLTSGIEYSRTFSRSPEDPEAVAWTPWTSKARLTPAAQGNDIVTTDVSSGTGTTLIAPNITTLGPSGYFERSNIGIKITRQGVYTGVIQVGTNVGGLTLDGMAVYRPDGSTTLAVTQALVPMNASVHVPFTVWAVDGAQGFNVVVQHSAGVSVPMWWRFSCARIGDAV